MLAIGLMSGTSVDGIDAALVSVEGPVNSPKIALIRSETVPYPPELRSRILAVCGGEPLSLEALDDLDHSIALRFANAALEVGRDLKVDFIASHGQTVYHRPPNGDRSGASFQLGRGDRIAGITGITTISNFRAADIYCGGQGAPLVPKVDARLLSHPTLTRCVQNIGGIGNVTYIPPKNSDNWLDRVYGWDTGPGNVLIDLAIAGFTNGALTHDRDGEMASRGNPRIELVERCLEEPFFRQSPPKSTGRELFGTAYLNHLEVSAEPYNLSREDFLATLTDLTAASIVASYRSFLPVFPDEVLLCGGGARNLYLVDRLKTRLGEGVRVMTTTEAGLDADFKEAIAFAVLGYWRLHDFLGHLPAVTGAKKPVLLGEIHS